MSISSRAFVHIEKENAFHISKIQSSLLHDLATLFSYASSHHLSLARPAVSVRQSAGQGFLGKMSAANLDAVKRKYKFKTVSIATWRDPSQSVLSVRGGPTSPSFPPVSHGRPYLPTYKVKYNHLPEPTDDEETGNEQEDESTTNGNGGPSFAKNLLTTY